MPAGMPALPGRVSVLRCFICFECRLLTIECFANISSFTLYGVTNPVTEVTKLVTQEESLTLLRCELRRAGPPPSESRKRKATKITKRIFARRAKAGKQWKGKGLTQRARTAQRGSTESWRDRIINLGSLTAD